ncbi:MAG: hypothetical protein P8181_15675, partial [bacterium]
MPRANVSHAERGAHERERAIAAALCSLLVIFSVGCGSTTLRTGAGPEACAALDSLFRASGFEKPLEIQGKATIDADQNQIRGKIHVDADSPERITFE